MHRSSLEDAVEHVKHELARAFAKSALELASRSTEWIAEWLRITNIDTLKYAWNLKEEWHQIYGLEEAVRWFKVHMPAEVTSGCILKISDDFSHGRTQLHLCFLDQQKRLPLLSGTFPHCIIYTLRIDDDLAQQFGDKSLLVMQ